MLINSVENHTGPSRREVGRALGIKWVEVKKGIPDPGENVPCDRPVRNGIVDILRVHIPYVLSIVSAGDHLFHAGKLTLLFNNGADIAAVAHPGEFSVGDLCTVDNHGSDCAHPVVSFSARLAFYEFR